MTQGNFVSAGGLRLLILILFAAVFTQLCVQESKIKGRLSSAPNYDDCTYFLEGAILLNDLKSDGVRGFFNYLNAPGPNGFHSPYSIILAAVSYDLFGPNEASPYYGNALLVIIYLACLGWIFRSLPIPAWMFALALFLTPPFITMGVVEFRPDIAWAVSIGFGVVFTVTSEELFRNPRRAAVAGLFLALALIIKPSTFVMTLLLYSGAIFSRVVAAVWENRWRAASRKILIGSLAFTGMVLVVAGPYWSRFGKEAISYFLENSFGANKAIWVYQGSLSEFLFYYVAGVGARSNVAIAGIILSLIALACLLYLAFKRPELRWKIISLLGLLAGAFAVNTVAQMKSAFLGGGIYGVWLFTCAYLLGTAFTSLQPEAANGRSFWRSILLAIAVVVTLLFYRWPEYSYWGKDRIGSANYRETNEQMKALLNQYIAQPPRRILFAQAGPIVMETTGLWFAFHHLKVQNGSAVFFRTEAQFRENYPDYSWIVLQEPGTMGFSSNMPSEGLLTQFEKIIKIDPNYRLIKEINSATGKKIWIYARGS